MGELRRAPAHQSPPCLARRREGLRFGDAHGDAHGGRGRKPSRERSAKRRARTRAPLRRTAATPSRSKARQPACKRGPCRGGRSRGHGSARSGRGRDGRAAARPDGTGPRVRRRPRATRPGSGRRCHRTRAALHRPGPGCHCTAPGPAATPPPRARPPGLLSCLRPRPRRCLHRAQVELMTSSGSGLRVSLAVWDARQSRHQRRRAAHVLQSLKVPNHNIVGLPMCCRARRAAAKGLRVRVENHKNYSSGRAPASRRGPSGVQEVPSTAGR